MLINLTDKVKQLKRKCQTSCTHVSVQVESRGGQDRFIYFTQIRCTLKSIKKNWPFLHELLRRGIPSKKPWLFPLKEKKKKAIVDL